MIVTSQEQWMTPRPYPDDEKNVPLGALVEWVAKCGSLSKVGMP